MDGSHTCHVNAVCRDLPTGFECVCRAGFTGNGQTCVEADSDGDTIPDLVEQGPDVANPVDSDGDNVPDLLDPDSDNDTIPDATEGTADPDGDGDGNWRDTDSDGDCRSDLLESGGLTPLPDTDGDLRPDVTDRDSDGDGLTDQAEDANCNGAWDTTETNGSNPDTDGDGADDLVEVSVGTNPNDAGDNPLANGDHVFVVPYQAAAPTGQVLAFRSSVQAMDVYLVLDRSGSMATETTTIRDNFAGVLDRLRCPPVGTGSLDTCNPDLQAGVGAVGYVGNEPFQHHLDIQVAPNLASLSITTVTGTPTTEPLLFGVWAAITGQGSAASGCAALATTPARTGCPAGTFGYPCFRPGVLPVVVLVTDEPPLGPGDTYVCPNRFTVTAALQARGAKVIGVYGSGSNADTISGLNTLARETGAVDAFNGNAPLVFAGGDGAAATAVEDGLRTLATSASMDLGALPADDATDSVDALDAFLDHVETRQEGTAQCANGLTQLDTNGDSHPDEYRDVRAGTPVCWSVVPKTNTTVMATAAPQVFRATVSVWGNGVTVLETREVYFVVPPLPVDAPLP